MWWNRQQLRGPTPNQPAKKARVLLKTEAVAAAAAKTNKAARAEEKTKTEVRRRPAAIAPTSYKTRTAQLRRHGASPAPGKAEGGAGPSMVDVDVAAVGLQQLAKEKASLEARVTDLLGVEREVHTLRERVRALQEQLTHMEQLQLENASLQAKLHSVTHSPLSDNEKQELLLGTRQHSSAPASMVASDLLLPAEESTADVNLGMSPLSNWDRQSASSASQLSVACLQDRILQMEETHHSTNEELQATLQELTDLQSQLQELQAENERLLEENKILMESLCQQTEKLEESRNRTEALQGLLLQEGTEAVRDDQLVDLLKNAQEKRDCLLAKQQELTAQVTELRQSVESARQDAARSQEAARVLEATVDAMHAERKQLDEELAQARQESSSRHIEVQRVSTLLDNARAKIEELESARELEDKSDLDEILDNVRKEKDTLESQVASLQEQVSRGQCEVSRLKEQLSHLQEECKVTRNNAKSALSDLEYQYETLKQEKQQLTTEVQVLQESVSELTMQCQCHLEDKHQLKALMSDCQRHLAEAENKLIEQGKDLDEERKLRQQESEEWRQFQTDLLTTVRVANDLKTEANEEMKKLLIENKNLRDKTRIQESQLEKLKAQKPASPVVLRPTSVQMPLETSSLSSAVHQEITLRHKGSSVSRQDSHLSVKSLIESIENATKQAKSGPRSRSSSTSSLSSIQSDVRVSAPVSVTNTPLTPSSQRRHNSETDNLFTKTPLRDQQQSNNSSNNMKASQNRRNAFSDNTLGKVNLYDNLKSGKPSEDVPSTTVSILANKTMDFVRRNSYSDLSERKDPLSGLPKNGGSKRNALLKWCQNKTIGYQNIEITNFSSSWNDGLALCAILHSYLPERIPYDSLTPNEKRRNFTIAFAAAESVGIPTTLNVSEMMQIERPDWQQVMAYVTAIYKHFET